MSRTSLGRSRSVAVESDIVLKPVLDVSLSGAPEGPHLRKRKSKRASACHIFTDQISRYLTASPDWKVARQLWWTKRRLRIDAHAMRIQQMLRRIESRYGHHHGRGRRRAIWCVDLRRRFCSLSAAARFARRSPNSILRAAARGGRCGGLQWEFCSVRKEKANAKTPRRQGKCTKRM